MNKVWQSEQHLPKNNSFTKLPSAQTVKTIIVKYLLNHVPLKYQMSFIIHGISMVWGFWHFQRTCQMENSKKKLCSSYDIQDLINGTSQTKIFIKWVGIITSSFFFITTSNNSFFSNMKCFQESLNWCLWRIILITKSQNAKQMSKVYHY